MPQGGPYGNNGTPDFLICAEGHFIAIEAKAPGERPTPLQHEQLTEWAQSGAAIAVLDTKERVDWFVDGLSGVLREARVRAQGPTLSLVEG